jgi:hypothetical protein
MYLKLLTPNQRTLGRSQHSTFWHRDLPLITTTIKSTEIPMYGKVFSLMAPMFCT